MKRGRTPVARAAGSLLGAALFVLAVWVLRHELETVTVHQILVELQSIAPRRLGASVLLTVLGYLALSGYDWLGLEHLGRTLRWRRVIFASFVSFALANNLPFAFVVGGSVRYRLYSGWGVPAGETAALVLFNIVTYALGLTAAAALAFTAAPAEVPRLLHLPFSSTRPLGLVALALLLGYLAWSWRGGRLRRGGRSLTPPPLTTSLKQIVVSLADWVLSGAALFVLFPHTQAISFSGFFGIFILGQIAALVAQLPGGLGVFEAVMLATLTPTIAPATVAGALIAYRVIYFFLPLALAAGLLAVREIVRLLRGKTQQSPV
jgi:glycosyltransferase 2 family protein